MQPVPTNAFILCSAIMMSNVLDDLIYYVSHEEEDPRLRLYVRKRLQVLVLEQYHEKMRHVGIVKTFDLLN